MNNAPGRRALGPDTRSREARVRARSRRQTTPLFSWLVFLIVLLSLFAISYVSETAAATESSYRLATLKTEQEQLQAEQQQTRYQISIASSAGSLDADAGRLGLVRQAPSTYLHPSLSPVALNHGDPAIQDHGRSSWLDQIAVAFGRPTDAQAKGR